MTMASQHLVSLPSLVRRHARVALPLGCLEFRHPRHFTGFITMKIIMAVVRMRLPTMKRLNVDMAAASLS